MGAPEKPEATGRLEKLRAAEENARRWVAYNAVVAERDKLAEEITREYPPTVDKLVNLVTRHAANDRQREVSNRHARPAGAEVIRSAEEVARGLFAFEKERSEKSKGSYHPPLPRLTTDMKLPKFAAAKGYMFAWPPHVNLVEKPVDYPPSADLLRAANAEAVAEQQAES